MTTFTREDYEMAAKAAGLRIKWIGDVAHDCTKLKPDAPAFKGQMWNPPEDDGDALRLAATLDMTIRFYGNACAQATRPGGPSVYITENYIGSDRMVQVRHAIFRAAIAIGRAMP